MATIQLTNPADIICELKAAVTALECYHNMDMIKQNQRNPTTRLPPMRILELECSTNKCADPSPMCAPELKFPEMRSGILYTRCYCVHRDGLQDDCPLTQCQGQPDCLCKPWPVCPPARYLRLRHPQQYPAE
ncbi:uncharacterized protein LOC143366229 [Andrena cerasifolii]|uniref:uncharacterized protein LOC143366229 n=1 Tax=Andrena cerasifolii TaxID=2819439 RepID=UPI0040382ECF